MSTTWQILTTTVDKIMLSCTSFMHVFELCIQINVPVCKVICACSILHTCFIKHSNLHISG